MAWLEPGFAELSAMNTTHFSPLMLLLSRPTRTRMTKLSAYQALAIRRIVCSSRGALSGGHNARRLVRSGVRIQSTSYSLPKQIASMNRFSRKSSTQNVSSTARRIRGVVFISFYPHGCGSSPPYSREVCLKRLLLSSRVFNTVLVALDLKDVGRRELAA